MQPMNGNTPNPTADAVTEKGERLATLPRGPAEELRVSIDEFKGHPYISLRVWSGGYPVKCKGVTVRLSEAEDVARALLDAVGLDGGAGQPARGATRGTGPGRSGLPFSNGREGRSPARGRGGEPFNEFEGGDG